MANSVEVLLFQLVALNVWVMVALEQPSDTYGELTELMTVSRPDFYTFYF